MATKFLIFPVLLSLTLYFYTLSAAASVVHISSAVPTGSPQVTIFIKVGVVSRAPINLSPGQETVVDATGNDPYFVNAVYGLKFTPFTAYDPSRDNGKADVYWRATNDGFEISYDKSSWMLEAPWNTE